MNAATIPGLLILAALLLVVGTVWLARARNAAVATGLVVSVLFICGALAIEGTGQPKPIALEVPWCRPPHDAEITWQNVRPDMTADALIAGPCGLRRYELTLSKKQAQELQDAATSAGRTQGGRVMMGNFEQQPGDQAPVFYEAPQEAPPPKDGTND